MVIILIRMTSTLIIPITPVFIILSLCILHEDKIFVMMILIMGMLITWTIDMETRTAL